jgi:hypothetical protein
MEVNRAMYVAVGIDLEGRKDDLRRRRLRHHGDEPEIDAGIERISG